MKPDMGILPTKKGQNETRPGPEESYAAQSAVDAIAPGIVTVIEPMLKYVDGGALARTRDALLFFDPHNLIAMVITKLPHLTQRHFRRPVLDQIAFSVILVNRRIAAGDLIFIAVQEIGPVAIEIITPHLGVLVGELIGLVVSERGIHTVTGQRCDPMRRIVLIVKLHKRRTGLVLVVDECHFVAARPFGIVRCCHMSIRR